MHPVRTTVFLLAALLVAGGAIALAGGRDDDDRERPGAKERRASAKLLDADGNRVGRVSFRRVGGSRTLVTVHARGLTPGFHGFHIHSVGACEAPSFTSAAGHLKSGDQAHGDHVGDLPTLLASERGTARAGFVTDRFTPQDLRDADGSAVVVHGAPDNYANIPTDRYDPDPDETTLNTGDAGPRVACGVVR